MHERSIMHRDIKCNNIFVHILDTLKKDIDEDAEPHLSQAIFKIGDFNISKLSTNGFQNTITGTPFYSSPEMINKKPYGFNHDIFCLGVSMYQFACLKLPWEGRSIDDLRVNQKMA